MDSDSPTVGASCPADDGPPRDDATRTSVSADPPRGQYWAGLPVVDERRLTAGEAASHRRLVDRAIRRARVRLACLGGALAVCFGGACVAGFVIDEPTAPNPLFVGLAMMVPAVAALAVLTFLVLAVGGETRRVRWIARGMIVGGLVLAGAIVAPVPEVVGPLSVALVLASTYLGPSLAVVSVRDDLRGLRLLRSIRAELESGVVLVVSDLRALAPLDAEPSMSAASPPRTFLVLPGVGIAIDDDLPVPLRDRPQCAPVVVEIPETHVEGLRPHEQELARGPEYVWVARALTTGEQDDLRRDLATHSATGPVFVSAAVGLFMLVQGTRVFLTLEGLVRVGALTALGAMALVGGFRLVRLVRRRQAVERDLAHGHAVEVRDRDGNVLGAFLPESGATLSAQGLPAAFRTVRRLDPRKE